MIKNQMTKEIEQQKLQWGVSYGELVRREFFKNKLNVVSLWFIGFLFFLAVFAPFLANEEPLIVKIDGQWQFPIFRSLAPVDYSVLWAGLLGVMQLCLIRRNRNQIDPTMRSKVLGRQLLFNGILLLVGIICFYVFIPERLPVMDYKALVSEGKATHAVFPLVPYGYDRTDLADKEEPPSQEHWLGTDDVGSDVLSRLIHGTRISLSVGFVAVGISFFIGVFIGALMGYFGGWVDFVLMRFVEIMMAVPVFFLIITMVAFYGRNIFIIMVIIGIVSWTGFARFIRAEFFRLRNQDFVQAARALGLPLHSILFRHMLPNGIAPVLVAATFGIAGAIFLEAALSFLGFGIAPPTPSWGQMLSLGVSTTGRTLWWLSLFPGLAIFFTVLAYNLVGEGLRDAIDPRLRKAA